MTPDRRVVVVGAGLAGLRTAENLRHLGHTGPITLLGQEVHAPYDRPLLSKAVLSAETPTTPWLREVAELDAMHVDLQLGEAVSSLDTQARHVTLGDGTTVDYDVLVIATGAVPRLLPATLPRPGLHLLRTVDDAHALGAEIRAHGHLVVVGGGFIGSEVAATARGMGADVVLVEALATPLLQAAGHQAGAEVVRLHTEHGVDVRCDTLVTEVRGADRVEGVTLSTGESIATRTVLVGLGVRPATDWLADSGLDLDDGIRCDSSGRTSAPGVYAVGDVAHWAPTGTGMAGRHEHWTSAVDQALVVATTICAPADGPATGLTEVPYFWSDLYGLKVQALGWPGGDRDTVAFRAGRDGDRLVVLYGSHDRLVGVLGFGVPRVVMGARPLLSAPPVDLHQAAEALGLAHPAGDPTPPSRAAR